MQIFDEFAAAHRDSTQAQFNAGLHNQDWIGFDWPVAEGGHNWTRVEKLQLIDALCEAGCPALPDTMTVIAPLLLSQARDDDRSIWLSSIRHEPDRWRFIPNPGSGDTGAKNTFRIVLTSDESIYLFQPGVAFDVTGEHGVRLGDQGGSLYYFATCASPLYSLHNLILTAQLIDQIGASFDDEAEAELTAFSVTISALRSMYLSDQPRMDQQILLKCEELRLDAFSMLFRSLGYYALLDPAPDLTSNEPLPYRREREHLNRLRHALDRNVMLQHDLMYQQHLESLS